MAEPLNPRLHAALTARLWYQISKPVRVADAGQPLQARYETVRGRVEIRVDGWGESYLADCPFCDDTRGRLSISHHLGVLDERAGTRYFHLWKCWNEDCQKSRENRDALQRMLTGSGGRRVGTRSGTRGRAPVPEPPAQVELPAVELPGCTAPLTALPADHPAVRYLGGRGFDSAELARDWGVGVCVHLPPGSPGSYCAGRIIIPVRRRGVTVGYQARCVGEPGPGAAKYLTCFPRSRALYGADEAETAAGPLVVVEGVTDVWRYGPGAVARLGRRLSHRQVQLIVELARLEAGWRPVVFVPDADDPNAAGDAGRDALDLAAAGYAGSFGVATLPPGTDPGSTDRVLLRGLVAVALASLTPAGKAAS